MSKSHFFAGRRNALFGLAAMGLTLPTAALATNERYSSYAVYCNGASYLCTKDDKSDQLSPVQSGVGDYASGGAYSARGGLAVASVIFAPGAPMLLQDGVYSASGTAYLSYTFQLLGAADTYVPLRIGANITAGMVHATDYLGNNFELVDNPDPTSIFDNMKEATNYSITSLANLSVLQNAYGINYNVQSAVMGDRNQAFHAGGEGLNIDETLFFLSNTDINVVMRVAANVTYRTYYDVTGTTQYGSVAASADPIFTIDDPAFSGFSIVGVPDGPGPVTTPPTAVPEPTSWVMMILGFGLVGGAMRTRRRQLASERLLAC